MRPPTPIHRTGRWPAISILVLLVLLAAACSASGGALVGGSPAFGEPAASEPAGAVEAPVADEGTGATGGGPAGEDGNAAPIQQRIIKTGEVSVQVSDVGVAVGQVRAFALELGGYVGGSQAGSRDETATLTLRVPAARFDEALERLHGLDGEVVAEATRESDVTRQIVDLGARISNLQASEASYRALLERAERIDDVLTVQARLDQVRGEIEQLQAQLQDIEGDADLSTLTVSIIPVDEPIQQVAETWDPGAQVKDAVAALVGIGQGVLSGLIWVGVVWVPVVLALALLSLVVLRGLVEVRRRWALATNPVRADREVPPG
jgi:hypothetical protein